MKIIIVDDSRAFMSQARQLIASGIPDVEITEYDPDEHGFPRRDFDWAVYDVLLLDYRFGGHLNGLDWLVRYQGVRGFPPVILTTDIPEEYVAAKAIKLGAREVICKAELTTARLCPLLQEIEAVRRGLGARSMSLASPVLLRDVLLLEDVLSAPPPKTPNGQPIGYRFVRLIGQGAGARVYLAERATDGGTLVLKIIDTTNIKDLQVLQRFAREAALIEQVNSPYVVRFFGHGFTESYGYIAMEFFTRGDLKQRMEQGVSVDDALNYVIHIALGLQAIHSNGIVHRDLKPGNIMFRSDDSLALADFGISKPLSDTSDLTLPGSVLGTPNYISPEQAQGRVIDHRSDLYSVGVILFEMLAGRKPYRAESAPALIYQHVHADIPLLPERLAAYQPVIEGLLAKDPAQRFGSARELVATLHHFLLARGGE